MKNTLLLFFLMTISWYSQGQQEAQYTQFVYHKLGLNPAFAGAQNGHCFTALYRGQWLGLEGAPTVQMLGYNTSFFKERVGFGVNLSRQTVGISRKLTGDLSYAYRIPVGEGVVGIGLQVGIRQFGMNYLDERLQATDGLSSDGGIPVGDQSRVLPNVGGGIYFSNQKFYIGASVPRMIENNIDFNDLGGEVAVEARHYYFMTGYQFYLSELFAIQPQVLMKYVWEAPFDADLNVMVTFRQRYMAGITYRLGGSSESIGESLDFLLSAQISESLLVGFAYDWTLSEIKDYSSGSIEALVQFCFGGSEAYEVINPRFF